jgi:peptide/nickel transport system substrate-binding protein
MKEMALYEALLKYEVTDFKLGNLKLAPDLAESWEQQGPTTVVLKLRKGVKFHDGSDFNADGAKWSLERMGNNPKSLSKRFAENFDKLEVVDPYTLKISYKKPSALQLLNLTAATAGTGSIGTVMVSKAQMDKVGEEAFGQGKVSGTGPMQLVDWKRDSEFTLKKFDNYWKMGEDGQKLPYLDGVRYRLINDTAVHQMELKAGTVHISRALNVANLPAVKSDPTLDIIMITWSPNRWYTGFNDKKSPFGTSLKLRQATQYATDRESMAKVVGAETGWPGYNLGWIPSWSGFDESLPSYKFDLNKAQQLAKESGENAPEIELLHQIQTAHKQVAEMVQQMWAKVGVKMTLLPAEQAAGREKIKIGQFDMHIWTMAPSPDPAHFERMFTCDGAANWNNYCNKETDKCMLEAQAEMDVAKRAEKYKTCQKIIYEDAQLSNLFNTAMVLVVRKEVKGLKMQIHSPDLQEVWLDK